MVQGRRAARLPLASISRAFGAEVRCVFDGLVAALLRRVLRVSVVLITEQKLTADTREDTRVAEEVTKKTRRTRR